MSIPNHSLVLYKSAPARVVALSDKLEIMLEDGRSVRVRPKDVLLLHPGPIRTASDLGSTPVGEVEDACALLEGSETTLAELAELVYGDYTPATAWAAWRLVEEGLYFQGSPEAIRARPLAEVEQERALRAAKVAEREAWNGFLQRARAGQCAAQDAPYLREIEEVALGQREQSRVLQALDSTPEPTGAYALLLRLQHWNGSVNPWPVRAGVALEPPRGELPDLPDEPRLDLTGLPTYAIDDEGNTDPDDALSVEGDRLWVHVADAAALIAPDQAADLEARARGATLYLPERTSPMLPKAAVDRLGLGLQAISPALSFGFSLAADGAVGALTMTPSWIRAQRISYTAVESRLEQEPFRTLLAWAERYQARRRAQGAVFIDLPEVRIQVEEGQVQITPMARLRSRMLVSEAMLMAGEAVAHFAAEQQLPFPYTTQEAPERPDEAPMGLAAMRAVRRTLRPRQYSGQPGPHSGLGLERYSQVTSPLRRYLDLVAHQQLRAWLRRETPLDAQAILVRVGAAEAAAQNLRRTERLSREHWTVVYLQQHPGWRGSGILVEKRTPRSVVLIPELALETRVKVSDAATLDSVLSLRLAGTELPMREAWFRVERETAGAADLG